MPEHEFNIPDEPEIEPVIPVNPLYERQAPLALRSPTVILVGAGGVGCWTALSLVLGGIEDITIFDGDTVSLNNLNRLPLPEAMVGELKSVALARWLETLRPKARIVARGMFDATIHVIQAEWVVCCTDSLKSRRACHSYAQDSGAKYLELGADGERWTLSPAPPEFSTELEEQAGYNSVPVHVGPCMMAGAAACYYILHDCVPIVSHSTNWIKGPIIRARPNLGALKFESMDEITAHEGELVTCSFCGVEIERDLIMLIKHYREHNPTWGLAEAKDYVEHELAQIDAVEPAAEDEDWTEEQVASHDEWVADHPPAIPPVVYMAPEQLEAYNRIVQDAQNAELDRLARVIHEAAPEAQDGQEEQG